jgi:hypothetical protein
MSAFVVDRATIDTLALAGVQWGLCGPERTDDLGRLLWTTNVDSVCYEYPDDDWRAEEAAASGYLYDRDAGVILDGQRVLWVLAFYAYQASDHPGWKTSPTLGFAVALREAIEAEGTTRGKDCPDGCWGLSRIEDAAAVVLA